MTQQRHFTVAARDGVTLDAIAQGPADHAPLILLHGFTDSRRSFEPLVAALPDTVHAIAYSQRGHGASQKPAGASAYRASRFADDVIAVLDSSGHRTCAVLGHSMGSWAALHCALRHPARISHLVLIGAFARFAGNPGVADLAADIAGLTDPVDPAFVRGFQEAASSPDLPATFFDMILKESGRLPADVWKAVAEAFLADDVPDDLSGVRAPTLVLWGEHDPFAPRSDQEALLRAIPAARLQVHDGLGHSPHWDHPAMVAAQITEFLLTQPALPKGDFDA